MALFENFPYTNIHELNLDWIVKIAKDFLEQYTHIQQLITDGETSLINLKETGIAELQEKADALEAALQAWYDTHSQDIAQQLADALEDLNAWYNQHEGYLDQYLEDSITAFNQAAEQKAEQTRASIPADYTTLSDDVSELTDQFNYRTDFLKDISLFIGDIEQGSLQDNPGYTLDQNKTASATRLRGATLIKADPTVTYYVNFNADIYDVAVFTYNSNGMYVEPQETVFDSWKNTPFNINGYPFYAVSIKRKDNQVIPVDANTGIFLANAAALNKYYSIGTDGTAVILKAPDKTLSQPNTPADAQTVGGQIGAIATFLTPPVSFAIGTYNWNRTTDTMDFTHEANRASADLRSLHLEQGDTVGITDYDTYSIAFGNNMNTEWYDGGYQRRDITANDPYILPYIILAKRNDNANMTSTDILNLQRQFHATTSVRTANVNKQFARSVNGEIKHSGYCHISFDDVGNCIQNLINNGSSFSSLWDEPFLNMLKNLHETYSAVFSLYIWNTANIANLPTTFKDEFRQASQWLKIGFHAVSNESSMSSTSYEDAKNIYNTFISNVFDKVGGVNSIDRMPRLNYYSGSLNALKGLRDANCGCMGFLSADDTRQAYYLSSNILSYLRKHSIWTDKETGLQFVATVMRLDWFVSGYSSQYEFNVPVQPTPYEELVYRYNQAEMADLYSDLEVFTHEWQVYNTSYTLIPDMVSMLEQVCRFANDYNYDFDYAQNRLPNITSYAAE